MSQYFFSYTLGHRGRCD